MIVGVVFCSLFAVLLSLLLFGIVKRSRFFDKKKTGSVEMTVDKVITNPATVVNNNIA